MKNFPKVSCSVILMLKDLQKAKLISNSNAVRMRLKVSANSFSRSIIYLKIVITPLLSVSF